MRTPARPILLRGGKTHTPEGVLEPCDLLLQDGRIEAFGPRLHAPTGTAVVEAQGRHVVPGFIDLQVNGGGGQAVLEGTESAVRAIARTLAPLGTTAFLPTLISAPEPLLLETLSAVRSASTPEEAPAASVVGVHLEGPFLNPEMAGAHPREHLRLPDPPLFDRLARAWEGKDGQPSAPALLTLAPELSGGLALLQRVTQRGWRPAFGHTKATFEEAQRAVRAGVRLATHAFNRMGSFHHREPGVLGVVLTDPRVTAGLIADGIHVHPAALQAALRLKGASGAFLVSDATPAGEDASESPPAGGFRMGDARVTLEKDRVVTSEGALAGALLSSRRALANAIRLCGFRLEEALPWVTETPARVLGLLGRKGVLAPGADADVAVLDESLEVRWVAVGGRVALNRL